MLNARSESPETGRSESVEARVPPSPQPWTLRRFPEVDVRLKEPTKGELAVVVQLRRFYRNSSISMIPTKQRLNNTVYEVQLVVEVPPCLTRQAAPFVSALRSVEAKSTLPAIKLVSKGGRLVKFTMFMRKRQTTALHL